MANVYAFDSVVPKDESNNFGKFKLSLDGLKTSHSSGTNFANNCIEAWCDMDGKRYSFKYELPAGATIDAISLVGKLEKGKMKVTFRKTSNFKVNPEGR